MTHKRLTELAMKKRREAHYTRRGAEDKGTSGYLNHRWADALEAEADAILTTTEPPIASMGEVTDPHIAGLPRTGALEFVRNTLLDSNLVVEEASITRTDLLMQTNTDISALAIDAADSINADNSMEKMLAHQMALAHSMAMKIGDAAMGEVSKIQHGATWGGLKPGAATELQRLTNSVARLMSTYQQGMLTLQRIKTGGNQTVTVQHVNVGAGGQAVIGNVQTGGGQLPGEGSING
jgi:hypothetical protein